MAQLVPASQGMFGVVVDPARAAPWLSPSRWAYAMAAATTVDLNDLRRTRRWRQDPLWDYNVGSWLMAAGPAPYRLDAGDLDRCSSNASNPLKLVK
ncbi:hypothetical protein ABLN97_00995 [Mycobacterium tuberculosis]